MWFASTNSNQFYLSCRLAYGWYWVCFLLTHNKEESGHICLSLIDSILAPTIDQDTFIYPICKHRKEQSADDCPWSEDLLHDQWVASLFNKTVRGRWVLLKSKAMAVWFAFIVCWRWWDHTLSNIAVSLPLRCMVIGVPAFDGNDELVDNVVCNFLHWSQYITN